MPDSNRAPVAQDGLYAERRPRMRYFTHTSVIVDTWFGSIARLGLSRTCSLWGSGYFNFTTALLTVRRDCVEVGILGQARYLQSSGACRAADPAAD